MMNKNSIAPSASEEGPTFNNFGSSFCTIVETESCDSVISTLSTQTEYNESFDLSASLPSELLRDTTVVAESLSVMIQKEQTFYKCQDYLRKSRSSAISTGSKVHKSSIVNLVRAQQPGQHDMFKVDKHQDMMNTKDVSNKVDNEPIINEEVVINDDEGMAIIKLVHNTIQERKVILPSRDQCLQILHQPQYLSPSSILISSHQCQYIFSSASLPKTIG